MSIFLRIISTKLVGLAARRAVVFTLAISLLGGQASLYAGENVFRLDTALQTARENNPNITAARKRWDSARMGISPARSPEDPQVKASAWMMNKSPVNVNSAPAEEKMLSVSQFIPLFGKLSLKGKIAVVEAQIAGAQYRGTELDIANRVKKAYFELYMSHKEEELDRESLVLLQGVAKTAQARYATGEGVSQADVLKISVEIARLTTDIMNLKSERSAKEAAVNNLLGRGPEVPLGVPGNISEDMPPFALDALYASTLNNQPELRTFKYAIERNKYEKSLAKRSVFPDIMTEITKRGMGLWDIMLSFTVPLWYWTKQRYQIKQAIANLEEAEAAYKAMTNQALAETKQKYTDTLTAFNKVSMYKNNLLPLLEQSIASSASEFSSGKGDFMELLDSQRLFIQTRMEYYRAVVELNMAAADLELAAGMGVGEVKL